MSAGHNRERGEYSAQASRRGSRADRQAGTEPGYGTRTRSVNSRNHTGSSHDYSMHGTGRRERVQVSDSRTLRDRSYRSSVDFPDQEPGVRTRRASRYAEFDDAPASRPRRTSAEREYGQARSTRRHEVVSDNVRATRGTRSQGASPKRGYTRSQAQARNNRPHEIYAGHRPAQQGISRRAFIGAAAVGAFALIFGGVKFAEAQPITIKVNGQEMKLAGGHNLETLAQQGGLGVKPGDYVAVDGTVIKAGDGYPFTARRDGQILTDYKERLQDGTELELSNGANIEEPADEKESAFPVAAQERGHGPLHKITESGKEGVEVQLTGKISGKTVKREKEKMQPRLYDRRYPDTKGEKVVCFTFDDGPLPKYTKQILDILKENDAKATFFTVGLRIEDSDGADMVKRAHSEGHEVCTHTWDHAAGAGNGVDLSLMTAKEQREEVQKGMEAIQKATGNEPPRTLRAPGGNFALDVWRNVEDLIDLEVGWDIDSTDWKRPGVDAIYQSMMSVSPGDIVLCHDGGGNRQQTCDALKRALPELKKKGFKFITVGEMAQYPLKESKDEIHNVEKNGKSKKLEQKSDANLYDKPGEMTGDN